MPFIADLHIHSRFSRATSKSLDLPNLDLWAGHKGLAVVGTGDAVHPAWLAEIEENLIPAEEGLYRLKPDVAGPGRGRTRFILSTEISSIYKQGGCVRKVHSLILLPDLEAAQSLSAKLDQLGNIRSDGRPILGLSAKDLLEICLTVDERIFFIPAHIWTPWFSLLGSKSGFDSVEECFLDLAPHIRALETGLSSDPPMNWRLSKLDGYVLVSNSDAHSPDKLGREANLFDCAMTYPDMVRAMSGGGGFGGTLEFFPEEGKYHMDGHRKCGVSLEPEETRRNGGLCPVCGKPVTVGVLNRVLELADRPAGTRPDSACPYFGLVPLVEVLSELVGVGPKSKKVQTQYHDLVRKIGPELHILLEAPLEEVDSAGGPLLAEAIRRMREGRVVAQGGYDGEYGVISLFEPGEMDRLAGQGGLFAAGPSAKRKAPAEQQATYSAQKEIPAAKDQPVLALDDPLLDDLNPEQFAAVTHPSGPLIVSAGPGTGKTLVLTRRAAWLTRENKARPDEILAVTFTRRAANEMSRRLAGLFRYSDVEAPRATTFHALGLDVLTGAVGDIRVLDEDERLQAMQEAAEDSPFKPAELVNLISLAKQDLKGPADMGDPELARAFGRYEATLSAMGAADFDDLCARAVLVLEADAALAERFRRFRYILVDEYQDINMAQARLLRAIAPGGSPDVMVIGDPDQAIYGFRGARPEFFQGFVDEYPQARRIGLTRSYRSSETILKASFQVIENNAGRDRPRLSSGLNGATRVTTAVLPTARAEAEYVTRNIENLLGGTSHFTLDSGRADSANGSELTLGDIAVLYRVHAQARPLAEALDTAGLPFQQAGKEPVRETDGLDFSAEKISLLTMHAAKGLEFAVVFVVGVEEGLLPYQPPNKPQADEAEERRLFYVALTRARQRLYLTRCRARSLFGISRKPEASVFWHEIEERLRLADSLPDRRPKPAPDTQMDLF